MILSICVPVYNSDMGLLLQELRTQIGDQNSEIELLVIDDASAAEWKEVNLKYKQLADFWEDSPVNLGRSKIRNRFLNYAKGDYILFLDCDVLLDCHQFISNYLKAFSMHPSIDVFYGSFKINPAYKTTLRNIYSLNREIPRKERGHSFEVLQTINFALKKSCFEEIRFDENLTQYGYEDFIFTKKLESAGKTLKVIENPVIHNDNTSNSIFLAKTKQGVASLYNLSLIEGNKAYLKSIKLFRVAELIQNYRLGFLSRLAYRVMQRPILANLNSEKPSLLFYDLYKLGELLRLMK